jgi:hypothetical protein
MKLSTGEVDREVGSRTETAKSMKEEAGMRM